MTDLVCVVGGIWGNAEFLQILADPHHPEYEERLEWVWWRIRSRGFYAESVNGVLRSLA